MPIDNNDIERLKDIFVTRQECDKSMDDMDDKLAKYTAQVGSMQHKVDTILWVAKTTLTSVIGAIVVYIASQVLY